jgi:phage-related protein
MLALECLSFDTLLSVKPVVFHPKARDVIRGFPAEIRDRLGKALYLLQVGEALAMPLSRPMPSVAPGVSELRLRSDDGQFRTFYFAASDEGILVLHAFVKKTQQTPPSEIQLARKRLKEIHDED